MVSTLVIGLGGLGGQVVVRMKKRMEESHRNMANHKFFLLDRNGMDLAISCHDGMIPGMQMRLDTTTGQYILKHPDRETIHQWFPEDPAWFDTTESLSEHRVLGRLAFFHAMEQGLGRRLEYMLRELIQDQVRTRFL